MVKTSRNTGDPLGVCLNGVMRREESEVELEEVRLPHMGDQ
jgi:hypothetical protein